MKKAHINDLLELAEIAVLTAGKAVMKIYRSGEFHTEMKPGESPLTLADKHSHCIITDHLGKTNLPVLSEEGIQIDFSKRRSWKYFWLIDPLDGTKEFINKNGEFTINIALVHGSRPVGGVIYVPCKDLMYTGSQETGAYRKENGIPVQIPPLRNRVQFSELVQKKHLNIVTSRSHLSPETMSYIAQFPNVTLKSSGSSLKFMLLLENQADLYPRLGRTMEWDTAAAHAILNASNRGVYQTDLSAELTYNKPDLANPSFIAF